MFSCELAKFLRTPFLQNTSGLLLLLLAFQEQPPEVFCKKGVLENFAKFTRKHLWFAKFSGTPFLQNTSATTTLLKLGTANSVWKTSDEYSLSRNTSLRSTVQVSHFFLGNVNFECMSSLVYTVYCQKQPPE